MYAKTIIFICAFDLLLLLFNLWYTYILMKKYQILLSNQVGLKFQAGLEYKNLCSRFISFIKK